MSSAISRRNHRRVVQVIELQDLENSRQGRREFLNGLPRRILLRDHGPQDGCEGYKDQKKKSQSDR